MNIPTEVQGMRRIRVLLIEDNRLLRDGIATMLEAHGDFDVVEISNGTDALSRLQGLSDPPQVILIDLRLAEMDSLRLMGLILAEQPDIRIIAMDIMPEHIDIVQFVEAGGWGFILKDATMNEYSETIRAVALGKCVLPPLLTKSLFTQIIHHATGNGGLSDNVTQLTQRERQIVDLISEGLSNKDIALRLHIATFTVKSHVHNVLEKLALGTRLQIAAFARKDGNS